MPYQIRLLATEEVLFTVPPQHRDLILTELVKAAQGDPPEERALRIAEWTVAYEVDVPGQT